jgi:hypothetical protein
MTKTLTWNNIRAIGKQDNAGRWTPSAEVAEYFSHIRTPSRAWPNSMAKAAQTAKFANWLATNRPEIAAKLLAN